MFKNTLITQITLFHIFKYSNKTREEETPVHSLMFPDMDKNMFLLDLSVWLYTILFHVKICTNSVLLLASLRQKYSKKWHETKILQNRLCIVLN